MNDYEILYMVNEHEDDSFDILVYKYKPLIYKIVKEYANCFKKYGYEMDDLMQLGYITLYNVANKYNIYNHSLFYSYLKKSLVNMIISNIRLNTSMKKEVLNNAISYDINIPNTNVRYIDLISSNKIREVSDQNIIVFKNSMPFILSNVFELYYNGYTKKEISVLLDEKIDDIKKYFSKIKEHALTYKCLFFD